MNTTSPRKLLGILIGTLTASLLVSLPATALASPEEEISKAVAASGAKDVRQAEPDAFINAFSSVLVGVDQDQAAPYVDAATKMRPDLASQISDTAIDVDEATVDTDSTDHRVSAHRRRVTICCSGHTLILPPRQAREHLRNHPHSCHIGACHRHHHYHYHQ